MTDLTHIPVQLGVVRERIAGACRRAGRSPDSVTLVGVTKTFPFAAVHAAIDAGLLHFGENKVQELVAKATEIPGAFNGGAISWHMIGHLQRNKARDVAALADVFEALDSLRLARELDRRAEAEGRIIPCYVQVNVSGEESKFGIEPEALPAFLDGLEPFEHLAIRGLMTLAAPVDDPEKVRPQFRLLRSLRDGRPQGSNPRIRLEDLSMGMSDDFEVAIEEGATHVRIGSAIFGPREAPG
jgi:PLP dependent protein